MKKIIYTIAFATLLWSCGGSGGDSPDDPDPIAENNAPSIPTLIYPSANLLCIDNSVNFSWNASTDEDGDNVSYQIQIAKDNQFTQIVQSVSNNNTTRTISLDKGVAYYWRVEAIDNKNEPELVSFYWLSFTQFMKFMEFISFARLIGQGCVEEIAKELYLSCHWALDWRGRRMALVDLTWEQVLMLNSIIVHDDKWNSLSQIHKAIEKAVEMAMSAKEGKFNDERI